MKYKNREEGSKKWSIPTPIVKLGAFSLNLKSYILGLNISGMMLAFTIEF